MTTLASMHGVLHTTSLPMLNQHTGASVARNTVDDVHFECRFVKPLLSIIVQTKGLTTHQAFLEATLFQSRFRRRNDKWCDMTHSVVYIQARVRWLFCNDITPKAIPLSERLTQCPHLARHANTIKLIELARIHRL